MSSCWLDPGFFSPFGWIILFIQAVVGVLCELPFLATRYRNYRAAFLISAGGFANLGPLVVDYVFFNFLHLAPLVQSITAVGHIAGGVLGALLAVLLTNALVKTGVLNSFAIGRERGMEV